MADFTASIETALEAFETIRRQVPSDSVAAILTSAAIIADAKREQSTEHFDDATPIIAFEAIRVVVDDDDAAARIASAVVTAAALREGPTEAPWWSDYRHGPRVGSVQEDNPSTREAS